MIIKGQKKKKTKIVVILVDPLRDEPGERRKAKRQRLLGPARCCVFTRSLYAPRQLSKVGMLRGAGLLKGERRPPAGPAGLRMLCLAARRLRHHPLPPNHHHRTH